MFFQVYIYHGMINLLSPWTFMGCRVLESMGKTAGVGFKISPQICLFLQPPGGRLNKKDGLTRYGDSHVKDKTS